MSKGIGGSYPLGVLFTGTTAAIFIQNVSRTHRTAISTRTRGPWSLVGDAVSHSAGRKRDLLADKVFRLTAPETRV